MRSLLLPVATALLCSCTWVELSPEGHKVSVAHSSAEVSGCQKIGSTTAKVLDKMVIERNIEKVNYELDTLARNQAAKMKGDRVLAISEINDGSRDYAVYSCLTY